MFLQLPFLHLGRGILGVAVDGLIPDDPSLSARFETHREIPKGENEATQIPYLCHWLHFTRSTAVLPLCSRHRLLLPGL